jgi:hypothetical protein
MTKEQYIKTGGDESYTRASLIVPIIDMIEEYKQYHKLDNVTIWCPFDVRETTTFVLDDTSITISPSLYVKIFEEYGYNVISTHIATGQDFFTFEPSEHYDLIISNPPFKNKRKFFERAVRLNKPFALVSTASWFNDAGVYHVFKDIQLQLYMPDKRATFFNSNGSIGDRPSFKSVYLCYNFLIGNNIKWFELKKELDD